MGVVLFALPLLGDITLGTALGVVGTIASFLLAPKPKQPTIKAMTSAWGESWPIVYNNFRISGKCIQAGNVTKHNTKAKKGGPTYSQTFAMGVCEGVATVGRIWADNSVIYDPRPITPPPAWQPNFLYGVGDYIQPTGITEYYFIASIDGESGPIEPTWNQSVDGDTRDGDQLWIAAKYTARKYVGQQYNFTMRVYTGTETQLPDAALEEQVGAGMQPAYRGLCYVVFESFDLSKYGNRIPNLEFEITRGNANQFSNTGVYYGDDPIATEIPQTPLLIDDSGNIYGFVTNNTYTYYNIKTATATVLSLARVQADALSFGLTTTTSLIVFLPIAEKYFIAFGTYTGGIEAFGYFVVLYEINTDGSATALGAKTYQMPFSFPASLDLTQTPPAVTVRSDTHEVMVSAGDSSNLQISILVLDTIANMMGATADRPFVARLVPVAEIGQYATAPAPLLGYVTAFVDSDLYIALNKANMDWLAVNPSGVGWVAYYASLQPTYPNGALIKISTFSDGLGTLTYTFEGVVSDFGWPFSDEGLNSTGAAGVTNTYPYDDYGPPTQTQDTLGDVSAVYFGRAYSDQLGEVGFRMFQGQEQVAEEQGATYGVSYNVKWPMMQGIGSDGAIYMAFSGGASGRLSWAKLGTINNALLTLADICADVSGRVGLAPGDYGYTALASVVPQGAALLARDAARSFLESLQPAFFYDLTDIGAQVIGSLRSEDTLLQTISEDDLAASPAGTTTVSDKISSVRNDDLEIPQDLSIQFYDILHDYQQGSQQARRSKITQYSSGRNSVSVPVVMNAGQANTAALRGLYLLWVERIQRKFVLPPEFLARTPADVVSVVRNGKNHTVRLTKVTLQPNWTIEVESVSEDLGTYAIQAPMPVASISNGGQGQKTINPVSSPFLAVLDAAQLRSTDTTPGVYVAASGTVFGGGFDPIAAQDSPDNSTFTTEATLALQATMGVVPIALATWSRYTVFDRTNSLTVTLYNGALGNAAESDLIDNFTNLAWLSNGEIIQFATATPAGADAFGNPKWTLSDLLRGRFGTESYVGTHAANETFVFLDPTVMQNVTYDAPEIGATRYWRGLNDAPSNPATEVQTLVMATNRLKPYAPSFIRGSRDGPGNLTITGKRRARWRGTPLWTPPETDTPVAMQIDILSGVTVLRTLTSALSANGSGITDPVGFTAYYAEADQVIDFGSPQASVSVKAYAMNALVGRGYGGARTI